ncbi:MAG: hypothetical protein U9N38_07220 [Thermodesulfobacteriota bacterium]|nr:hypothetical protein [Thermodesulfobacteriota bacterium]
MKRYTFGAMWLALLFVIVCSVQEAGADPFCPTWQTRDKWLVKAVYRSHLDKDKWSEPVFWEYKIVGLEGDSSEGHYILEIRDRENHLKLNTRLVYRAEDLSLIRAEITKTRRGKEFVRVLTYEGGTPVITEQTLTPFDTPVFPLTCPSFINFEVIKQVGTLKEVRTIRQEVRQVSWAEELPDQPPGTDLIEVRCMGKDGLIFVQYWDRTVPWPLYGQNINMKYWLVKE